MNEFLWVLDCKITFLWSEYLVSLNKPQMCVWYHSHTCMHARREISSSGSTGVYDILSEFQCKWRAVPVQKCTFLKREVTDVQFWLTGKDYAEQALNCVFYVLVILVDIFPVSKKKTAQVCEMGLSVWFKLTYRLHVKQGKQRLCSKSSWLSTA